MKSTLSCIIRQRAMHTVHELARIKEMKQRSRQRPTSVSNVI